MKVLILAGGLGSRLGEETGSKPKPMVEVGGKPILWHIMNIYAYHGFKDFVILLGYKGYMIKEYFSNYLLHESDLTVDLLSNHIEYHSKNKQDWKVTLVDTGNESMTGGRIKRAKEYIGNEPFMLTYGDGVADVDVKKLVQFHEGHGKACTVSVVQPDGRFGALKMNDQNQIIEFLEKPKGDGSWINGGFFVCEPSVLDLIEGDKTIFEQEPLQQLSNQGEIMAFQHNGFWKCMDTLKEKIELNEMWENDPKWKVW